MVGHAGWNGALLGENYWRFLPPTVDPAWMHLRRIGKQGNISANYMSPANTFHYRPDPEAPLGTAQASFRPDADHLPNIDKAMEHDLQFVQRAGDVVWIPPGWWCAQTQCFGSVRMQCARCTPCRPAHGCGCGLTARAGSSLFRLCLQLRLARGTDNTRLR